MMYILAIWLATVNGFEQTCEFKGEGIPRGQGGCKNQRLRQLGLGLNCEWSKKQKKCVNQMPDDPCDMDMDWVMQFEGCEPWMKMGFKCEDTWMSKCGTDHPLGEAYNDYTLGRGVCCTECGEECEMDSEDDDVDSDEDDMITPKFVWESCETQEFIDCLTGCTACVGPSNLFPDWCETSDCDKCEYFQPCVDAMCAEDDAMRCQRCTDCIGVDSEECKPCEACGKYEICGRKELMWEETCKSEGFEECVTGLCKDCIAPAEYQPEWCDKCSECEYYMPCLDRMCEADEDAMNCGWCADCIFDPSKPKCKYCDECSEHEICGRKQKMDEAFCESEGFMECLTYCTPCTGPEDMDKPDYCDKGECDECSVFEPCVEYMCQMDEAEECMYHCSKCIGVDSEECEECKECAPFEICARMHAEEMENCDDPRFGQCLKDCTACVGPDSVTAEWCDDGRCDECGEFKACADAMCKSEEAMHCKKECMDCIDSDDEDCERCEDCKTFEICGRMMMEDLEKCKDEGFGQCLEKCTECVGADDETPDWCPKCENCSYYDDCLDHMCESEEAEACKPCTLCIGVESEECEQCEACNDYEICGRKIIEKCSSDDYMTCLSACTKCQGPDSIRDPGCDESDCHKCEYFKDCVDLMCMGDEAAACDECTECIMDDSGAMCKTQKCMDCMEFEICGRLELEKDEECKSEDFKECLDMCTVCVGDEDMFGEKPDYCDEGKCDECMDFEPCVEKMCNMEEAKMCRRCTKCIGEDDEDNEECKDCAEKCADYEICGRRDMDDYKMCYSDDFGTCLSECTECVGPSELIPEWCETSDCEDCMYFDPCVEGMCSTDEAARCRPCKSCIEDPEQDLCKAYCGEDCEMYEICGRRELAMEEMCHEPEFEYCLGNCTACTGPEDMFEHPDYCDTECEDCKHYKECVDYMCMMPEAKECVKHCTVCIGVDDPACKMCEENCGMFEICGRMHLEEMEVCKDEENLGYCIGNCTQCVGPDSMTPDWCEACDACTVFKPCVDAMCMEEDAMECMQCTGCLVDPEAEGCEYCDDCEDYEICGRMHLEELEHCHTEDFKNCLEGCTQCVGPDWLTPDWCDKGWCDGCLHFETCVDYMCMGEDAKTCVTKCTECIGKDDPECEMCGKKCGDYEICGRMYMMEMEACEQDENFGYCLGNCTACVGTDDMTAPWCHEEGNPCDEYCSPYKECAEMMCMSKEAKMCVEDCSMCLGSDDPRCEACAACEDYEICARMHFEKLEEMCDDENLGVCLEHCTKCVGPDFMIPEEGCDECEDCEYFEPCVDAMCHTEEAMTCVTKCSVCMDEDKECPEDCDECAMYEICARRLMAYCTSEEAQMCEETCKDHDFKTDGECTIVLYEDDDDSDDDWFGGDSSDSDSDEDEGMGKMSGSGKGKMSGSGMGRTRRMERGSGMGGQSGSGVERAPVMSGGASGSGMEKGSGMKLKMVDCSDYIMHCMEPKEPEDDECMKNPRNGKECGESCCDKREECEYSDEKGVCYTPKPGRDCSMIDDPCKCMGRCGWSSSSGKCTAQSTTDCGECPSMKGCINIGCVESDCPDEYDELRGCQCTEDCEEHGNCCDDADQCKMPEDMCGVNPKNGKKCGETCCGKQDEDMSCVFEDGKCMKGDPEPKDMCGINSKNGKTCGQSCCGKQDESMSCVWDGERCMKGEMDVCFMNKKGKKKCNKKCCKKRKKDGCMFDTDSKKCMTGDTCNLTSKGKPCGKKCCKKAEGCKWDGAMCNTAE